MNVRLETSDGHIFVTKAKIPGFVVPPEVIMWGFRVFRLFQDGREYGPEGEPKGHVVYREAFYYAIPVEEPAAKI